MKLTYNKHAITKLLNTAITQKLGQKNISFLVENLTGK